jgi:hypothetical protein
LDVSYYEKTQSGIGGETEYKTRINSLTPNDLQRRRAVSPLKVEIPIKNMREKPTNATFIHSVY